VLFRPFIGQAAKPRPRTRTGRISRAYNEPARDQSTPEFLAKCTYLINGSAPQLAATASGILLANAYLTAAQHHAALSYAWAHALTYGRPWRQACALADRVGSTAPDELLERAKEMFDRMNFLLTAKQRQAVGNVAVFGLLIDLGRDHR
jgi:hypothetical protein